MQQRPLSTPLYVNDGYSKSVFVVHFNIAKYKRCQTWWGPLMDSDWGNIAQKILPLGVRLLVRFSGQRIVWCMYQWAFGRGPLHQTRGWLWLKCRNRYEESFSEPLVEFMGLLDSLNGYERCCGPWFFLALLQAIGAVCVSTRFRHLRVPGSLWVASRRVYANLLKVAARSATCQRLVAAAVGAAHRDWRHCAPATLLQIGTHVLMPLTRG